MVGLAKEAAGTKVLLYAPPPPPSLLEVTSKFVATPAQTMFTFFHGTRKDLVPSIMKYGLEPTIQPVFLTGDIREAYNWGKLAVEFNTYGVTQPAVLKVLIPKTAPLLAGTPSSWEATYSGVIPPKQISKITRDMIKQAFKYGGPAAGTPYIPEWYKAGDFRFIPSEDISKVARDVQLLKSYSAIGQALSYPTLPKISYPSIPSVPSKISYPSVPSILSYPSKVSYPSYPSLSSISSSINRSIGSSVSSMRSAISSISYPSVPSYPSYPSPPSKPSYPSYPSYVSPPPPPYPPYFPRGFEPKGFALPKHLARGLEKFERRWPLGRIEKMLKGKVEFREPRIRMPSMDKKIKFREPKPLDIDKIFKKSFGRRRRR